MILSVLLLLLGLLLVLLLSGRLIFINRFAAKIPTIRPCYPMFGHSLLFWGKSTKQIIWIVVQYFSKVDRLGKGMFGPLPIIMVNHPDLLQQILTRNDLHDKPFFYAGVNWYRSRKVLGPTFNTRILAGFIPIMDEQARKLATQLRTVADGCTEIDIFQYASTCTLDVVLATALGQNVEKLTGQQDFVYNAQIIHKRRQELIEEDNSVINYDEFQTKSLNFLDQILTIPKEDGTRFTDHEISDHLHTIILTGRNTTSLTVSYACLFLAMYTEIQEKVQAEIDEVFFSSSVEVTQDSLNQLQYTEMVLKEVLRLCPVAPLIARKTTNELNLDGIRIPKGQMIAMNFYTLHRRKDIWGSEPERFDPERFRPEAIQGRHPYAFLPFSGGLRSCIGARYAMNSMRVLLLRVLQEFDIKTNLKQSDLRFKYEVTLKLVGPHSVLLTKRNKC